MSFELMSVIFKCIFLNVKQESRNSHRTFTFSHWNIFKKTQFKSKKEQKKKKILIWWSWRLCDPYRIGSFDAMIRIGSDLLIRAIQRYFSDFPNTILVVPSGSSAHEIALFIRKSGARYDVVVYNPNHGENCEFVNGLIVEIQKDCLLRSRGYSSECFNVSGQCSKLMWKQILLTMIGTLNPFSVPSYAFNSKTHKYCCSCWDTKKRAIYCVVASLIKKIAV